MALSTENIVHYEGRPIVKSGSKLIYGGLWEPFFCQLSIRSTKDANGVEVADDILVKAINNDPSLDKDQRVVAKVMHRDLLSALEWAKNWLDQKSK